MSKLGYIRTSTDKQITDRQVNQLQEICDQVFIEDGVSAVRKKRPVYDQVMKTLNQGDVFVVSSLDRTFRSSLDALSELEKLHQRDIQFLSLSQNFETTTPDGKFLYTLAAALATWEREILSQRTKEGLEAVKRRGKKLGRPRKLNEEQIAQARQALEEDFYSSITELTESFRVHERTLIRALDR
jgi:DNA invertase Pin-like site-specific DNA recombinase